MTTGELKNEFTEIIKELESKNKTHTKREEFGKNAKKSENYLEDIKEDSCKGEKINKKEKKRERFKIV